VVNFVIDAAQDKYILGMMVILCGVCIWHAVVGAAAVHYKVNVDDDDDTTTPEMTSWSDVASYETTSSLPNASAAESTVCSSTAAADDTTEKMAQIVMADRMALATFGSVYLLFHVVFVARIYVSVSCLLIIYYPQ